MNTPDSQAFEVRRDGGRRQPWRRVIVTNDFERAKRIYDRIKLTMRQGAVELMKLDAHGKRRLVEAQETFIAGRTR